MDRSILEAFKAWFFGFRSEYEVGRVLILSLGQSGWCAESTASHGKVDGEQAEVLQGAVGAEALRHCRTAVSVAVGMPRCYSVV